MGIVDKKMSMVFLHIGVAMVARCGHVGDVARQIIISLIPPVIIQTFHEKGAQFYIQGVLPGAQELMIMDTATPPIPGLIMEDFALLIEGFIGGSPKNTVRVGVFGSKVIRYIAIVTLECKTVIVPVHRHGKCVPNE